MNTIFVHRISNGFQGHALDHYVRNYIFRLRYHLSRFGLAKKEVVRFLSALEVAPKTVHLIH